MKTLALILLTAALPSGAFAWAGYDYAPVTSEQRAEEQELASNDPAIQPLDLVEMADSDSTPASDTIMPLDAD